MINNVEDKLRLLAERGHSGQFRKGPKHLPYIIHPAAVVEILKKWGVTNEDTLAIAWGHDLLEDTDITQEEIIEAGNHTILNGISALTCPVGEDKYLYIKRVALREPNILLVKAADRIHNTQCFIADGDKSYAIQYFNQAKPIFTAITHVLEGPYADPCTACLKSIADLKELLNR